MPKPVVSKKRAYLRKVKSKFLEGERLSKVFERRISQLYETPSSRETAHLANIKTYGKSFLASFPKRRVGTDRSVGMDVSRSELDSPVSVCLFMATPHSQHLMKFQAKLGFGLKTVFIETIQGPFSVLAGQNAIKLNKLLGMPWPNFLLRQVENHARMLGYTSVRIHDPATSPFFSGINLKNEQLSSKTASKLAKRFSYMEKKNRAALPLQLSKDELSVLEESFQFRSYLSGKMLGHNLPKEFWDGFFLSMNNFLLTRQIQSRIVNFVGWVAKNNGYTKQEGFFIKKLSLNGAGKVAV